MLNIAVTDVHRPGSELGTSTSCSFSSYVTITNFAIAGFLFLNFSNQHPVEHKSTSAVMLSSDSSLSERLHIHLKHLVFHHPPFEEHEGRVKRHPWKSSVLTSEKFTGLLTYENEGFSLFCYSYFLPFFNDWVTIFKFLGLWTPSQELSLELERCSCILFPYDQ